MDCVDEDLLDCCKNLSVRLVIRTLQVLLGLTVCALYAAPASSGSRTCAYAVLTVLAAFFIGYWNEGRTEFFPWEVVLL